MSMNELLERNLPKWPQMIVTGTPISREQALEIIRRTDVFFTFFLGNDKEFITKAKKLIGLPQWPDDSGIADAEARRVAFDAYFKLEALWCEDWEVIRTEYVHNDWISSSYVGGPNGWCHPNGAIGYAYNVGKWPSVQSIQQDWAAIAKGFPFLELEVTLMDGEWSERGTAPVVSMLIRQGAVELVDPKVRDIHKEFDREAVVPKNKSLEYILLPPENREHAISLAQIQKWAAAFREKHPEYAD